MAISYMCWNVRHFKGDSTRADKVSNLISSQNPDIFGLLEFQAKSVMRDLMFNSFPGYDFAVTDSKNGTEITVGWKRGRFSQAIWTQKREFLSGNINLRPGGLLTVNDGGGLFNFLFLHTDSGTGSKDYENRQDMFKKIWELNSRLKQISSVSSPRLIALGDLNTMGRGTLLTGADEIEELGDAAASNGMRLLTKDAEHTWHQWGKGGWGNRRPLTAADLTDAKTSDLDHVLASDGLNITLADATASVHVEGWNQLSGQERAAFLWDISDHSAICGVVS